MSGAIHIDNGQEALAFFSQHGMTADPASKIANRILGQNAEQTVQVKDRRFVIKQDSEEGVSDLMVAVLGEVDHRDIFRNLGTVQEVTTALGLPYVRMLLQGSQKDSVERSAVNRVKEIIEGHHDVEDLLRDSKHIEKLLHVSEKASELVSVLKEKFRSVLIAGNMPSNKNSLEKIIQWYTENISLSSGEYLLQAKQLVAAGEKNGCRVETLQSKCLQAESLLSHRRVGEPPAVRTARKAEESFQFGTIGKAFMETALLAAIGTIAYSVPETMPFAQQMMLSNLCSELSTIAYTYAPEKWQRAPVVREMLQPVVATVSTAVSSLGGAATESALQWSVKNVVAPGVVQWVATKASAKIKEKTDSQLTGQIGEVVLYSLMMASVNAAVDAHLTPKEPPRIRQMAVSNTSNKATVHDTSHPAEPFVVSEPVEIPHQNISLNVSSLQDHALEVLQHPGNASSLPRSIDVSVGTVLPSVTFSLPVTTETTPGVNVQAAEAVSQPVVVPELVEIPHQDISLNVSRIQDHALEALQHPGNASSLPRSIDVPVGTVLSSAPLPPPTTTEAFPSVNVPTVEVVPVPQPALQTAQKVQSVTSGIFTLKNMAMGVAGGVALVGAVVGSVPLATIGGVATMILFRRR